MHAIRLHEFGPAGNLRLEELPDPLPGAGQVRIAVAAAGVHLIDTRQRRGVRLGPLPLPALPTVPGREVAGVVDLLGPDADPGLLGRPVVAHLGSHGSGGYAELVVAPVGVLHEVPAGVGAAGAVAAIGTGRTAFGILDQARLVPGDVVLVTAAAGGLGSLFVQAVRRAGATVVGLAGGPEKVARVAGLGAQLAVDYNEPGWPEAVRAGLGGRPVTLLLDGVGGDAGRAGLKLLGPGGRLLIFGWSSGRPTELSTSDLLSGGLTVTAALGPALLSGGVRGLEERALAALADGWWAPELTAFPLAEAALAHQALESRQTTGKVVLVP